MLHRLEKLVFFSLIFSIPLQKRIFLFGLPAEASAKAGPEGFFEWSSGFLYFTDLLVVILFVLCLHRVYPKFNFGQRYKAGLGPTFALFVFLFLSFAFVSLTQAELVAVGVYRFIKLSEFVFLFFYVASHVGCRKSHIKQVLWAFVASGVFQSMLALLQFARQSSLGLEIFHESTLAIGLKGVAEISAGGVEFIRAYGTFPSPNVLAGFLGICLLFAFCLFLSRTTMPKRPSNPRESIPAPPLMYGVAIFLLSFGFLLTFSRGVVIFFVFTSILFFAGMFLFKKFKEYRKKSICLLGLVIVSWALIVAVLWPETSARFLESSVGEPAIQERLFFNEVGVDTLRHNYARLFFGVGMGNFVHSYMQSLPGLAPHLYQPVHNIFILIASEIGILGLLAFVLFMVSLFKKFTRLFASANFGSIQDACYSKHLVYYTLAVVFCFLVLVSTYDHYFWTLQQGGLMFWISLGLLAGAIRK